MSRYSVSFAGHPSSSVKKFALVDSNGAGLPVSVADRHLDGGAILLDQQFARIELETELLRYQPASVRAPIAGASAGNALKSGGCHQQGGWAAAWWADFDGG